MDLKSVHLRRQGRDAILSHARNCWPQECCGLVAGGFGRIEFVYPLTNAAAAADAFTIAPMEHFRAWKHAEARGWELMGDFHSHPDGPPHPSPTDLRLAHEPDWVHLIVAGGRLLAFTYSGASYEEIALTDEWDDGTGRQDWS